MKKRVNINFVVNFFERSLCLNLCLCLFVLFVNPNNAKAQIEAQFTQYMFNETFINPAYVGSHESVSATLLYRNQWVGIEGAPKTQTFSIHAPLKNRHVGIGISAMNEEIGISHQLSVNAYFAYRILYPHSALSFGLGGGFSNQEERFSDVRTIVQGDQQFMTDVNKKFMPNSSFGIYYYNKHFYAGISIPRLMENKIIISSANSVVENKVNYKLWHYNLASGYVFDLKEDLKFKPSIFIKVVQNAPVEIDVNANFIIHDLLWLGAGYRSGDAVAALFGLQLRKNILLGYSYDYTLTPLKTYNSGTHEISLRYNFGYNKKLVISTRYF